MEHAFVRSPYSIPLVLALTIIISESTLSQYIPYKSTKLTAIDSANFGASVLPIHAYALSSTHEWKINSSTASSSPSSWNMLMDLDQSWSFHPTEETIVTITINGRSTSANMELAFNVNNDYFTTKIYLDNTQNNQISPDCDYTANPTLSMLTGNVSRSQSPTDYAPMIPTQYSQSGGNLKGFQNDFPLIFRLRNTPSINATEISYQSATWTSLRQFCGFSAFDTDSPSGLQIYLSMEGEELIITSIEITQDIPTLTLNPSITPTVSPLTATESVSVTTTIMNQSGNGSGSKLNFMDAAWKWIFLSLGIFICCCLGIIVFLLIKKRGLRQDSEKVRKDSIDMDVIMNDDLPPKKKPSIHHAVVHSNSKHSLSIIDSHRNVPLPTISPTYGDNGNSYSFVNGVASPSAEPENSPLPIIMAGTESPLPVHVHVKPPSPRNTSASLNRGREKGSPVPVKKIQINGKFQRIRGKSAKTHDQYIKGKPQPQNIAAQISADADDEPVGASMEAHPPSELREPRGLSFPGVISEKDKTRSNLSVLSDVSASTFIPPAPEVVFRSDWGKGLDKTVDNEDGIMKEMMQDMADSQLDLKIRKHYLSDAQREELQKQTPR